MISVNGLLLMSSEIELPQAAGCVILLSPPGRPPVLGLVPLLPVAWGLAVPSLGDGAVVDDDPRTKGGSERPRPGLSGFSPRSYAYALGGGKLSNRVAIASAVSWMRYRVRVPLVREVPKAA